MNRFPCAADFEFWRSKQKMPAWARPFADPKPIAVKLGWYNRFDLIDRVVSAHALPQLRDTDCALHNFNNFIRGYLKRGALYEGLLDLSTVKDGVYAERYRTLAARLMRKLSQRGL